MVWVSPGVRPSALELLSEFLLRGAEKRGPGIPSNPAGFDPVIVVNGRYLRCPLRSEVDTAKSPSESFREIPAGGAMSLQT